MKTKYAVYSCEAYEDPLLHFLTTDENYAHWYCKELNKCHNHYETYYYNVYKPPKISKPSYKLSIGFLFEKESRELVSSGLDIPDDGEGIDDFYCYFEGSGSSYAECLYDATGKLNVKYLKGVFGFPE